MSLLESLTGRLGNIITMIIIMLNMICLFIIGFMVQTVDLPDIA